MGEKLAIVVLMSLFLGAICWVVWVIATNIRRSKVSREQIAMQNRLLDKFGASQELLAYLDSSAGHRFLETAAAERQDPYTGVLKAVRGGIVSFMLGGCFLALRYTVRADEELRDVLYAIGLLGLSLGIGLLLSAAASYTLSKKWGLLEPRGDSGAR